MLSNQLCKCGCGEYTEIADRTRTRKNKVVRKGEALEYVAGHNKDTGPGVCAILHTSSPTVAELDLDLLAQAPDDRAAVIVDERVRFLDSVERVSYAQKGILLMICEQRELWKYITDPATGSPYGSWTSWVIGAAPWSYRACHDAKGTMKNLLKDVPAETLAKVSRCNLKTLEMVSTEVRQDPEILEAAQVMSEDDFKGKVSFEHPDQHIEKKKKVVLFFDITAYDAIVQKMADGGFTSWEQAVEAFAAEYECQDVTL